MPPKFSALAEQNRGRFFYAHDGGTTKRPCPKMPLAYRLLCHPPPRIRRGVNIYKFSLFLEQKRAFARRRFWRLGVGKTRNFDAKMAL